MYKCTYIHICILHVRWDWIEKDYETRKYMYIYPTVYFKEKSLKWHTILFFITYFKVVVVRISSLYSISSALLLSPVPISPPHHLCHFQSSKLVLNVFFLEEEYKRERRQKKVTWRGTEKVLEKSFLFDTLHQKQKKEMK